LRKIRPSLDDETHEQLIFAFDRKMPRWSRRRQMVLCSSRHLTTAMLLTAIAAIPTGAAAQGAAQTGYTVVALPGLGDTSWGAWSINDRDWVSGTATLSDDATQHAVLWIGRTATDLGTLGGPNSYLTWPQKNMRGLIVGVADTAAADPLGENFCSDAGDTSGKVCRGFAWSRGVMRRLPTLGGNNSFATAANDRGEIVGFAETARHDSGCVAPRVLQVEAAVWEPEMFRVRALRPPTGDTSAFAGEINSRGEIVGSSGDCKAFGAHAVLWHNGSPLVLPSLGGTGSNFAEQINERGQIVGMSTLSDNATAHAALWQGGRVVDLGTLAGDNFSEALGINSAGQIVGYSCNPDICRAVLWRNGVIADLNTLEGPNPPLYLYLAGDINDRGEVAGLAINFAAHFDPAFVAIPTGRWVRPTAALRPPAIPETLRRRLSQRAFGRAPR
jgi:probable HAF family extracellular repeat protein